MAAQSPFGFAGNDIPYYDPETGQMSGGFAGNLPGGLQVQPGQPGQPPGQPQPSPFDTQAAQSVPTGAKGTTGTQINDWYMKYTGRMPETADDPTGKVAWDAWANMDPASAEAGISGSAEAKAFAAKGAQPAAASPATATPGASAPGFGPRIAGIPNDPKSSAFFDLLMGKARGSANVDPNDPIIKAQTDAFRANASRGAKDIMALSAERGGPYQDQSAVQRSALEHAAQSTAGYSAQLSSDERAARRQDINQALSTGAQFLTAQQAQQLQEELDRLNLQERSYEFDSNDAYRYSPFAPGAVA